MAKGRQRAIQACFIPVAAGWRAARKAGFVFGECRMPLDAVGPVTLAVDADTVRGVPRHLLARHAIGTLAPGLRRALIAIEVEDGGCGVNMGVNFGRVLWRAAWRLPGLPATSGVIAVRDGEIVG
jgi:hypothetical protein